MNLSALLAPVQTLLAVLPTSLELGLTYSLTVLALFLSYSMLNVCDLSTDGCFTLGAVVGAMVALSGHPYLSIPAAMGAGMLSGLVAAILQTRMGVDSLLSGIIVNTGLYSVNIAIMKGASQVSLSVSKKDTIFKGTVFTRLKDLLKGTPLADHYELIILIIAVGCVIGFLAWFLNTKLGLAIRATGNNIDMVRSSSINPAFTTTVGLCIANSFTGLSGCLLAQAQKSCDINIGSGVLTIALASLLIGRTFFGRRGIPLRALGVVIGSVIFRIIYAVALRMKMPAYMLKFTSSVIVILTICLPYLKSQYPTLVRRFAGKRGTKC